MIKKKRFIASAFAVFCLASMTTAFAGADDPYHNFDGGLYNWDPLSPGTVTSVYTDIFTPTYPADYSPSGTCAWDMITGPSNQYVQVGWGNQVGMNADGIHYFYEINYADGRDYQVYDPGAGPNQNSTHGYRVALSGGQWVGTVDGVQKAAYSTTGFSGGTGIQYAEEIHGTPPTNSAFAGTSSDHAVFSNMRAFYNNTTYYSPSLSWRQDQYAGLNHNSYTSGVSTSMLEMWDTRY